MTIGIQTQPKTLAKKMLSLVLVLGSLKALAAPAQSEIIDAQAIKSDLSLTPFEKSEHLTSLAEKLVNPQGYMFANEIIQEALILDPNNKKAQFYLALLRPQMTFKGFLKDIEPLIEKEPAAVQRFYNQYAQVKVARSGLQNFLLNGYRPIRSEGELQKRFDKILEAQNELREHLKSNKDLLQLNVNIVRKHKKQSPMAFWKSCRANKIRNFVYELTPCRFMSRRKMTIDRADIEVLQQVVAGAQISTSMLTSYSAEGTQNFFSKKEKGWNPSAEEITNYFQHQQGAGQLRASHKLDLVHSMGADLYAGAKWVVKMQNTLCSHRVGQTKRPGYMFEHGICLKDQVGRTRLRPLFALMDRALNRQSVSLVAAHKKAYLGNLRRRSVPADHMTEVRLLTLFERPVESLKSLLPTKFNDCGEAQNLGDSSMGGLFIRGDGAQFFQAMGVLKGECRK